MPAAVTPIRPAVACAEITRWRNLTDTAGTPQTATWEQLFAELSRVGPFRGKDIHPGWSAAVFDEDKRAKAGVQRVTAAVLDYDGTASIDRALETWAGHFGLLHTTRKHRDDAPRFRVILPLRRPVSGFEWEILWQRLQDHCDGASDIAAKDASRFWYTPGILEGGEFLTRELDGVALDPDIWLRKPAKRVEPVYVAPEGPYRPTVGGMDIEERARRYVAKMPEAISGQNGHGSLWKIAITCARGFALDQTATLRILRDYNGRCVPPTWTETELRHKADDAVSANVPIGYLLKDRPNWTPPADYFREPPEVDADGVVIEAPGTSQEPHPAMVQTVNPPRTMADLLGGVLERAKSGLRDPGVSTCHYKLDHMLAGFRPKMITVLGARTSFGKSSYAIMVTDEALNRGDGVLLISAEDGEETYAQRYMARRARVNAWRLRANNCTREELSRMEIQTMRAPEIPFFVDAIGKPAEWIAETIRRECKARAIKLVVVDYLQRISATKRTQDKRTEVTHVMSCIADAIKESNAAGLVLSQLKRLDGGVDREPSMSDLKESGDIENMAEHVVLGWLTEKDEGGDEPTRSRFLKVEKNKDGPVDTRSIDIGFDIATAGFKVTRGEVIQPVDTDQWDDDFQDGDDSERRFP